MTFVLTIFVDLRREISVKLILCVCIVQDIPAPNIRLELNTQQKGSRQLPMQRVGLGGRRREAVLHEGAAVLTNSGGQVRVAEVEGRVLQERLSDNQSSFYMSCRTDGLLTQISNSHYKNISKLSFTTALQY